MIQILVEQHKQFDPKVVWSLLVVSCWQGYYMHQNCTKIFPSFHQPLLIWFEISFSWNQSFHQSFIVPFWGDGRVTGFLMWIIVLDIVYTRFFWPCLCLFYIIQELEKSKPIIVTGDLNCTHQEIDIYNATTGNGNFDTLLYLWPCAEDRYVCTCFGIRNMWLVFKFINAFVASTPFCFEMWYISQQL